MYQHDETYFLILNVALIFFFVGPTLQSLGNEKKKTLFYLFCTSTKGVRKGEKSQGYMIHDVNHTGVFTTRNGKLNVNANTTGR